MKTKIFLQEILIKMFRNSWLFAWWIKKHRLDDRIVDFLIREKFNLLEKYARRHQLSSYQITVFYPIGRMLMTNIRRLLSANC